MKRTLLPSSSRQSLLVSTAVLAVAFCSGTAYGQNWGLKVLPSIPNVPTARAEHVMAYDAARQQVVLFGGNTTTALGGSPKSIEILGDTWVWDGSNWTQKFPQNSPPMREMTAMVYDAAHGQVVLFGGNSFGACGCGDDSQGLFSDTWVWDGSNWTKKSPQTSPPARNLHAMAYDAARGQVVLFGGLGDSVNLNDTWVWDGNNWTQKSPQASPHIRRQHAMAYDAARSQTVMFGGYDSSTGGLADTWVWDGINWTQKSPQTSPDNRTDHSMAYDSVHSQVVLFGGFDTAGLGVYASDTWIWDGSNWTPQSPKNSPPPRFVQAMAFDTAQAQVVLFGGFGGPYTNNNVNNRIQGLLSDTWVWDGSNWTQKSQTIPPPARVYHAMAYDSPHQQVVLFGGANFAENAIFSDTWLWNGTGWLQTSPQASPPMRWGHTLAFDSVHQQTVLFGGQAQSTPYSDTWIWDGGNWVQKSPATSPPARFLGAMAYDTAHGQVVLFGGRDFNSSTALSDTWVWDGANWTKKSPQTTPPARYSHAMVYDAARGQVVLFGGQDTTPNFLSDTWVWDGSNWTQKQVQVSPPLRSQHAMAYDSVHQYAVLFGGANNTDTLSDTWLWDGAKWTPDSSLITPPARVGEAMTFDTAHKLTVMFGGTPNGFSAQQYLSDTWVFPAASIVASSGTPQSTLTGQPFPQPLEVTVTDISGNLVNGEVVTFSADPLLVTLSSYTATTGANGRAQVTATAAATTTAFSASTTIEGGYKVTASIADGGNTTFALDQHEQGQATCTYMLTASSANIPAAGGNGSFSFTASGDPNCAWNVTSNQFFITITSGTPGFRSATRNFSVDANTGAPRTGTITLGGPIPPLTFTINQDGAIPCTFTLLSSSANIPGSGGTGSFSFTASGPSCTWTATPSAPFISITSATSGTGSGTVNFSVPANAGAAQSGSITLGGQTFTVNQAATSGCTFTLTTSSANVPVGGGAGSFSFTASGGSCAWTATPSPSFVSITSATSGTGSGSVSFSVTANAGAARSGTITLGGQTFTINQAGTTACTFTLTTSSANIPVGGGTGSFSFTASGGSCAWTATPSPSFVSITSATSGTGSGSVSFSVAANAGPARSGAITLGGQTFTINQAGTAACSFTLTPTSAGSPIGGGPGSFTVNASGQSCAWSAASNNSFITVTSGANGTGNGTVNYTVAVNSGAPRSGTITAAGLTFTVNQAAVPGVCARFPSQGGSPGPATLLVSPSTLNFGINGGSVTGPQTVTLIFSNAAGSSWTATSNRSNIVVSPASGSGSGAFQVTVSVTPGPSGVITVTSAGAINSPRQVQVNVANVGFPAPFGSFDTPSDNATNISGAKPLGGWALDSVEVVKVDIWREKIGNEDVRPNGLVFIGDAMFVPGARPDVQASFPNLPFNTRAGWGYALLTTVLPNNGGSPGPGNGTYKLHAIAHDRAGLSFDLGARTITVDNAHATKPFGTIDTPTQNDSVTGTAYQNFGWALTPKPNSIPADGSTITVLVDGVAMGHPTYNQYRSDVANLFPGLANSNGAAGNLCIDTTSIPNGLHTISWVVFDNANNGEGLGSRYFTVLNSSALAGAAPEEPPMRAANRVAELPALEPDSGEVQTIQPDVLGRIEFQAGAATGYLLANGERMPLPVGSALVDGVFYWQPGAGFHGDYNLIFERSDGSSVLVRAVVGGNRR